MSQAARQQNLYGIQNWQSIYQTISNADFKSYDYETLRKSMIDYLQLYHPENFNDYINSSEFIALIDVIAMMGQSLSFRFDLNARENFLNTAQSRAAITNLAQLISYNPQRNLASNGFMKLTAISTDDDVTDNLGNNLNSLVINWNDSTNQSWQDQWNSILNAVLTSSQTIGRPGNSAVINGITTLEYGLALSPGSTPPIPFAANVDNTSMSFEFVNPTSVGQSYIYEQDPSNNTIFNLLYENDTLGFNSPNTGYFLYFKQGSMTSEAFSVAESLPNQTITLGTVGINNTDVWLFQMNSDGSLTKWTQVDSVVGQNTIYNNQPVSAKNIYAINSGSSDTISLVFGDGTFGNIPVGNFICYMRVSNGMTYRINPNEMSNIQITIPYFSKNGRTQNLTINASLLYTVANSSPRESLTDIKTRAPQSYYTQNRMVNGQDYNSFPFTQYSNILKIKAQNRTSSGVSRYLDVIDPTGRYSNTNIFGDDGFIYEDPTSIQTNYTYGSQDELASIIENIVVGLPANSGLLSFFYDNYPGIPITETAWTLSASSNSAGSGYLSDSFSRGILATTDQRFAPSVNQNSLFINGAILQFTAPPGYVFDVNNSLVFADSSPLVNQSLVLYTVVKQITLNGIGNSLNANGVNVDGTGAIGLSQIIPTGALLTNILPVLDPTVQPAILQSCITAILNNLAVSLEYNAQTINNPQVSSWLVDSTLPLNYSPVVYGTEFQTPVVADNPITNWLFAFVPGNLPNTFTVYQRNIKYVFGSERETTFYFDPTAKIYNPSSSTMLLDTISILRTNGLPGQSTSVGFTSDIPVNVNNIITTTDGLLDIGKVQVQYTTNYNAGIPDNLFFFQEIVGSTVPNYIFLVTDNLAGTVSIIESNGVLVVSTITAVDNNLYTYENGQIFFTLDTNLFYQVSIINNVASRNELNNVGDQLTYQFFTGRQDLKFQYQHFAPANRRIDPSPSNIIDMYILESNYATAYQAWITDTTGQVAFPTPPTTDSLSNDFAGLSNFKMVSDLLIFNPVNFKPLFGAKADPSLRAQFVVVQQPTLVIGAGEIASQVITQINNFFAVSNWDFGETFYVSELTAYIHSQLSSIISSVSVVPTGTGLVYGNLQQVFCLPNEIFTSAATVGDVSVVSDLNSVNLRIGQ